MNRREQEKIAVRCLLELEAIGISVEILDDLDQVSTSLEPLRSGPGLALDAENLLLTQANSFWVLARRDSELFAAFGVRVDDLGTEDAQRFLARSIKAVFGVTVTGSSHPIYSDARWKRAAYFGGFVAANRNGLRRDTVRIFKLLAGYAHHCAFVDLKSDVNYSFHRGVDELRGASYGFLRRGPFVWSTEVPIYPDGNPEWVMQLHREDLPALLADASKLLRQRLTEDS